MTGQAVEWEPMTFPPISETFKSVRYIHPSEEQRSGKSMLLSTEKTMGQLSINMISKEDDQARRLSMIRPFPPGFALNNWTVEDLPTVVRSVLE